jgi:hypothetical protein
MKVRLAFAGSLRESEFPLLSTCLVDFRLSEPFCLSSFLPLPSPSRAVIPIPHLTLPAHRHEKALPHGLGEEGRVGAVRISLLA